MRIRWRDAKKDNHEDWWDFPDKDERYSHEGYREGEPGNMREGHLEYEPGNMREGHREGEPGNMREGHRKYEPGNTMYGPPYRARDRQRDRQTQEQYRGRDADVRGQEDGRRPRRHVFIKFVLLAVVILAVCLLLRSCRARDEPRGGLMERIYEDNAQYGDKLKPSEDNRRINLILSDNYQLSDEKPQMYFVFPEDNIFDIRLTIFDALGEAAYQTEYIAPGTVVAIDGSAFLEKGKQKRDCLVSIYDHDTGALISDSTTMILNIDYE